MRRCRRHREELPFALPLVFLVLLVPSVNDRATASAAVVAAVVAVAAAALPASLGMPPAMVAGIATITIIVGMTAIVLIDLGLPP